jgi:hypothetical protein
MIAISFSETLVITRVAGRHIQEDGILYLAISVWSLPDNVDSISCGTNYNWRKFITALKALCVLDEAKCRDYLGRHQNVQRGMEMKLLSPVPKSLQFLLQADSRRFPTTVDRV